MRKYSLVPHESTKEMELAAECYWNERRFKGLSDDLRSWAGIYQAMIAAAPVFDKHAQTLTPIENKEIEMKTTTFDNARIGDRVWCIRSGWGEVKEICNDDYPLIVMLENGRIETYTTGGLYHMEDVHQSLFWDEVKFEAPKKPLPSLEVDAKVLVWNGITPKTRRYFSHFSASGEIMCFVNGLTSWTTNQTARWDRWELAE